MDRNFIEQSILHFAKKFPESIYLYKDQFMHVNVIHDGSFLVGTEVKDIFRSRFFVAGYTGSSPLNHPQTIQAAAKDTGTLVIAFNGSEVKSLEQLIVNIPFLKKNMVTLMSLKKRTYFAALDEAARPFIVVRAESKQEFIAAVDRMKNIGKIDPLTPVQTF